MEHLKGTQEMKTLQIELKKEQMIVQLEKKNMSMEQEHSEGVALL